MLCRRRDQEHRVGGRGLPRGTRPARRPREQGPSPRASAAQVSQLNALITLLIGNLSAGDRMKIMTICTIDVHARDVVAKMIAAKARAPGRAGGDPGRAPGAGASARNPGTRSPPRSARRALSKTPREAGGGGGGGGAGRAPEVRTRLRLRLQVESSQAFTWQSQLRHRWDEEKQHCFANICDAQIQYSYEYLGNTPRLVITPLTDR